MKLQTANHSLYCTRLFKFSCAAQIKNYQDRLAQNDASRKHHLLKMNKSVYVAKSRQRYYKALNNILLHVPNHVLKASSSPEQFSLAFLMTWINKRIVFKKQKFSLSVLNFVVFFSYFFLVLLVKVLLIKKRVVLSRC